MPKLVATKNMTYATRHLRAGDSFDAVPRDARVLKAIGKARDDYNVPVQPLPEQGPPVVTPPAPAVDMDALRAEAEAAGVSVDRRWGEARLRQEIASAPRQRAPEPTPETEPTTPSPTLAPVTATVGGGAIGSTVSGGQSTVSGAMTTTTESGSLNPFRRYTPTPD